MFDWLMPLLRAIFAFILGGGGDEPTMAPTVPVSRFPTQAPMIAPSTRTPISRAPIVSPTRSPITGAPVVSPTKSPIKVPTSPPPEPTTFYAIADLPYSPAQGVKLLDQMENLPLDAEFVIHLGDLRLAGETLPCRRSEYDDVAARLRASHAPVFVIVGDNDWTDCPNRQEGWDLWFDTFVGFESEHWEHDFQIRRQNGRTENFSFVHSGSLFIGLNIVGGRPGADTTEWEVRLREQLNWVKFLVRDYRDKLPSDVVGRVVIFGHATPNSNHNLYFFNGLKAFIKDELRNEIPILYMNGDKHVWQYDEDWYDQSSWLRVMLSGNAKDPPTKVTVRANSNYLVPSEAFLVDRRLNA